MAATNFGINLSEVSNVEIEYYNLEGHVREGLSLSSYIPIDLKLKDKWFKWTSELDSPLLKYNFDSRIPSDCYKHETLEYLCQINYYKGSSSNLYDRLVEMERSHNFYHGKAKDYINKTTFIDFVRVRTLLNHSCLSFGIKRQNMLIYTYDEIYNTFDIHKRFVRPDGRVNDYFEEYQIDKLVCLCAVERRDGENLDMYRKRRRLLGLIENIRRIMSNQNKEVRELIDICRSSEIKEDVIDCLKCLLNLSLKMRGWDGVSSKLPLREAPINNQALVDVRVSENICEFEKKCDGSESGGTGFLVMSLPLMWYQSGNYTPSPDSTSKTIRDRINIVLYGDSYNDIRSCIRLSSNWLLFTSIYYLENLGADINIDLRQVQTIG